MGKDKRLDRYSPRRESHVKSFPPQRPRTDALGYIPPLPQKNVNPPLPVDPPPRSDADTAAGEIAAALHAEKLVFLTDVTGIMRQQDDEGSLLSTVHVRDVEELIDTGVIGGGMIPKTRAGVHAVRAGVHKAHIIDGRIPHSVLLEFFTDEGVGTQIVQ